MREIKFRVWNDKSKEMLIPHHANCEYEFQQGNLLIGETYEYGTHDEFVFFELMQYTGLKDKNGVEIYENDVCRITFHDNSSQNMVVRWIDGKAGFFFVDKLGDTWRITDTDIEVIGNIRENPELLGVL